MNVDTYRRFVAVTEYLSDKNAKSSLSFQNYIEKQLNSVSYAKFLEKEDKKTKTIPYYIRLKRPFKKNSKERGLKICMFNDNVFTEKSVEAGTTIINFTPLLKVVNFSNNYCCECGKCLIEFRTAEEKLTDVKMSNPETNHSIKECLSCNLRVFCSKECQIAANLKWHNLECMFIQYMRKEIITPKKVLDCFEIEDEFYQRSVMLILTSFRLLLLLADATTIDYELIANFSDHFEIYEKYLDNQSGNTEQGNLFETTVKVFAPLIQRFFTAEKQNFVSAKGKIGDLNEKGLVRLFLLVFVNVSTLMNYFNNDIGLMFDPLFSMINHSCDPNCTIVWKDQCEISIKSTKVLKPAMELSMNYIPIYMPKEMRQRQLMDSFFFHCECEKCRITDKKYDMMLPLCCKYCGQNCKRFTLKNFEINDCLPNMDKKVICNNCEGVIDSELIFSMYMKIMKLFQQINPHLKEIEMLVYWNFSTFNIGEIEPAILNKAISIWKDCYENVSLKSWPMSMLTNLVKAQQQAKDPYSMNTLQLTYLSGFLIENMLETESAFKTNIGLSIYDLAVSAADFLFDQYLVYRREIDKTILDVIGWGTFSLCILSFKHLSVRFDNKCSEKSNLESRTEKAQRDMIQLSNEILFLFKHLGQQDDCLCFNNKIFTKHILKFEAYMDCGCESQLESVIIPLEESDYLSFGITPVELEAATNSDFESTTIFTQQTEVAGEMKSSAPSVLLKRPKWINEL